MVIKLTFVEFNLIYERYANGAPSQAFFLLSECLYSHKPYKRLIDDCRRLKGMVQMSDLTVDQLLAHANELCQKHWGVEYTGMIELLKQRWKYLDAKFFVMRGCEEEPIPELGVIAMSRKRNAELTDEEVLGILLHELVHWRLYSIGVPNRDSNQEFVTECLRVGAPISLAPSAQRAYKRYVNAL